MSPELKQAVQERIELGHTKEQIANELEAAGYDHETIERIYESVSNETIDVSDVTMPEPENTTVRSDGSLIGYAALVQTGFAVAASQWKVFVLTCLYQILAVFLFGISFGVIFGLLMQLPGGPVIGVLVGLALAVFYFLIVITLIGAMLRAVLFREEGNSFGSHIGWVYKRMWSAAGVAMLQQFVISNALYVVYFMVAIATAIALSGAASFDPSSIERLLTSGGAIGLLLLAAIGYIGTLVVVLILTAYSGWAMLSFVSGRAVATQSVNESVVLVKGRLMPVFWRLLFFGLLGLLFMIVVSIVLAILDVSAQASENISGIVQLLAVPFLVSASVLLYESLYATKQPITEAERQKIATRVKISIWTGAIAIGVYFLAIAALMYFAISFITGMTDWSSGINAVPDPTQFQLEQADMDADMQAELEAFQQQFQAEFEAN